MNNKLIDYNTAVLARNKGLEVSSEYFYVNTQLHSLSSDGECLDYLDKDYNYIYSLYDCDGHFWFDNEDNDYTPIKYYVLSQSLLQKWLREKHSIHIEIIGFVSGDEESNCYYYHLRDMTKYDSLLVIPDNDDIYDTYEKALESGLYESLKLIK